MPVVIGDHAEPFQCNTVAMPAMEVSPTAQTSFEAEPHTPVSV